MIDGNPDAASDEPAGPRAELLRLARATIAHYVATGEMLPYKPADSSLIRPAAVFVTLRRRAYEPAVDDGEDTFDSLRGCIGQIEADQPLFAAVQDAAVKAATGDPRFDPVVPEELPDLLIEISILSGMRPLDGLDDLLIGQDGLLIVGEGYRGLLLPHVPLAFGWDKETYVTAVCRKAGLPDDAWPGRARLYAFTTETFEESL